MINIGAHLDYFTNIRVLHDKMQKMHPQFTAIPLPMPGEPAVITQPASQNAPENNLVQGYNHTPTTPNASVSNSNNATLPAGHGPMAVAADSAYRAASVINLSNSNDIVIGPMTQYQGSVTIYQYMDATVDTSSTRPPGGLGTRLYSNCKCFLKGFYYLIVKECIFYHRKILKGSPKLFLIYLH